MYQEEFSQKKKKFYQYVVKSNNLRDIDDDAIKKVDEAIKKFKESFLKRKSYVYNINPKFAIYTDMLSYLLARNELTFDEKMMFIIRYFDPELKVANLYLNTHIVDKREIKNEDNEYVKQELTDVQIDETSKFEQQARNLIGIYDPHIVKFELMYYKKITEELRFDIKKNYIELFFQDYIGSDIDLTISDEELESIIKKAQEYKKKYGIPSLNDLAFQLIEQSKVLGITNNRYASIFMIYVMDENFDLFRIYDECGNWHRIEDTAKTELGYYSKPLLLNEVKYSKNNTEYSPSSTF